MSASDKFSVITVKKPKQVENSALVTGVANMCICQQFNKLYTCKVDQVVIPQTLVPEDR